MYLEPSGPHHRPHFHAYYQEHVGIYAIDEIELLAGNLPARQERLAIAWAEIHQRELRVNWDSLQKGAPPSKIDPLRETYGSLNPQSRQVRKDRSVHPPRGI